MSRENSTYLKVYEAILNWFYRGLSIGAKADCLYPNAKPKPEPKSQPDCNEDSSLTEKQESEANKATWAEITTQFFLH